MFFFKLPGYKKRLKRIESLLQTLVTQGEKIVATLDEILADVTAESTALDSVAALITGLQQQLADALAGLTLPPGVQAKIDSVFAQAESNKAKIAAALAANVPPPPPPGP